MIDSNTRTLLDQALAYLAEGLSVIPVSPSAKIPLTSWKQYQKRLPTKDEVTEWWKQYPEANIGIVTGKISNVIVIDIDPRHGGSDKAFKEIITPKVKTGGDGQHVYFLFEPGFQNATSIQPGIDVRGEGGYVVAPFSIHASGNYYEWIVGLEIPLAPLPAFVKDWIKQQKKTKGSETNQGEKTKSKFDTSILDGVAEGERNNAAATLAGKLLSTFAKSEWDTTVWKMLLDWNKKNKPPLEETELKQVFESIKQKETEQQEEEKEKNQSVALQLVEEIQKERIIFFHNEQKEGFAAIKGDGREIYKLRSRGFRQYTAHYVYKQFSKIVSTEIINNITQVLEGRAIFDGPQHELAVRIAFKSNAVWYDLQGERVVYIDRDGWSLSDFPPILFRRFAHQSLQVEPQPGGDIRKLCEFVNLKSDEERLLFLVFTIAAFIPGFQHPILVLYGPQGAGKTTPQRVLKLLIDPSVLRTLSAPDGMREFVQLASHHYFLFLDNMSSLPAWLSDSLAKAVTGDGFSKRELFSDDDDVIYNFQRVVALNGINLVVQRADLLERSILLGLERIPKEKRREEQEFWAEFERQKPYLLGAIFDAVSNALRIYPTVQLTSRPRMADFARWGCAIAEAMGYTNKQFLTAYGNNIAKQNTEAIEASPVATAVVTLIDQNNEWEGTATDLHRELERLANELRIDTKSKNWPKDPAALSRKLHVVATNLAEEGISIVRDDTARPKRILIHKIIANLDNGDIPTENTDSEAKNSMSASDITQQSLDIIPDNEIQPQPDDVSGLSGLSQEIPEELLNAKEDPNWAQYFPKQPLSKYSDGQLLQGFRMLSDFKEQFIEFLTGEASYSNFQALLQSEIEKRNLTLTDD